MIIPRNDYVLIERLESVTHSGLIVIPDVAKERSMTGKVIAVGPGKLVEGVNGGQVRKPVEVKPGDVVYFNSKWDIITKFTIYSRRRNSIKNTYGFGKYIKQV